ncbi:MAG: hypothetical protein O2970_11840 [Proteobacteria bacterium]|nr:hypothetical protein [Pseudomonadota bacterium]
MEQMSRVIMYFVVFFITSTLLVKFMDMSGMRSMAIVAIILLIIESLGGFSQIPHFPNNIREFFKRRIIRQKINLRKKGV